MPENSNPASPPPLRYFKGEMVLASIAYRSAALKRGMSADKIKTTLESIDPGNITIPKVTVTVH